MDPVHFKEFHVNNAAHDLEEKSLIADSARLIAAQTGLRGLIDDLKNRGYQVFITDSYQPPSGGVNKSNLPKSILIGREGLNDQDFVVALRNSGLKLIYFSGKDWYQTSDSSKK